MNNSIGIFGIRCNVDKLNMIEDEKRISITYQGSILFNYVKDTDILYSRPETVRKRRIMWDESIEDYLSVYNRIKENIENRDQTVNIE